MSTNAKEYYVNIKEKNNNITTVVASAELGWEEDKPLNHARWSRIIMTIIKKNGNNKEFVRANIPAKDVGYLHDTFHAYYTASILSPLLTGILQPMYNKICNDIAGDCYTVNEKLHEALNQKVRMGSNAGKMYKEIATDRSLLQKSREFLSKNLAKFPGNKKDIDIIDTILNASEEDINNELSGAESNNSYNALTGSHIIYDSGMRISTPLKDKNGNIVMDGKDELHQCCQIIFSYEADMQTLPFKIQIKDIICPIEVAFNGKKQMRGRDKMDEKSSMAFLSPQEAVEFINETYNLVRDFETSSMNKQYSLAKEITNNNYKRI